VPDSSGIALDASHTLVTGWDDVTDLVPAVTSQPVPVREPAPAALFGILARQAPPRGTL